MGVPGKTVVQASGKVGILPSGKTAIWDAEGECPTCCGGVTFSSSWLFTDTGFINGGQDGAARGPYADPSLVSASPWEILAGGFKLRLNWEDDYNCADPPHNPYTQGATATATIVVPEPMIMTATWLGMAERQDPGGTTEEVFEYMELSVGGLVLGRAHSPGGGFGCEGGNGPVVSDPAPPQSIALLAGTHTLFISATTNDQYYHVGAWYQFSLSFVPA